MFKQLVYLDINILNSLLAFVSREAFLGMRLVSTYFHWNTNYILGLEKTEKELTAFMSQKIFSNSSIWDHGKGPGFPPHYNSIWQKAIFIWPKSNSIQ